MAVFRLGDISTIQTGLILARKRSGSNCGHIYKQLTLKSLGDNTIDPEAVTFFYTEELLQNEYLTRAGTIVMKLSAPFHPTIITQETEGYLIPSQMVSIKPKKSALVEYLRFYLSQDFVAEHLLAHYVCIAQKSITVELLSNLEIRLPSLKNQQRMCEYYQNYRHLCRLREKLEIEEKTMMQYVFSVLSKGKELP
ncbi:MAG: restriction endonuclease subunit S [Treponema sp.]|nr:restriction endonuclease subunit S [Treponema sp.]